MGELFLVDVFVEDVACQAGDFAFGFVDCQLVYLIDGCQAGAVVAPVFKASLGPMYPTIPHIVVCFVRWWLEAVAAVWWQRPLLATSALCINLKH